MKLLKKMVLGLLGFLFTPSIEAMPTWVILGIVGYFGLVATGHYIFSALMLLATVSLPVIATLWYLKTKRGKQVEAATSTKTI